MRSEVSVEASELNADETDWTEACIVILRDDGDEEFREQVMYLTPAEFEAVYEGIWLKRNEGIWSFRSVES